MNFNLRSFAIIRIHFFVENSPNFCECQKLMVTCVAVYIYEPLFTETLYLVLLKIYFIRIVTSFQRLSCQN